MVMMQIKFNSLFYKLSDAVWQSRAVSIRRGAPGVLAGQPCSEASGPWFIRAVLLAVGSHKCHGSSWTLTCLQSICSHSPAGCHCVDTGPLVMSLDRNLD